jgi:hypothetical protein
MRKAALLLSGVLILFAAGSFAGVTLKLGGGLHFLAEGDYGAALRGAYESLAAANPGLSGDFRPFRTEARGGLEVLFPLGGDFELGLGAAFEKISIDNRFSYLWVFVNLDQSYESRLTVIPVTVNLHRRFGLGGRLALDVYGGAGYYAADFHHSQSLGTDFFAYSDAREFTARTGTVGFQGGASLDLALGESIDIFLQADGRFARIADLKGELSDSVSWFLGRTAAQAEETSFWYYETVSGTRTFPQGVFSETAPPDSTFRNVRAGGLDLSGFGVSAGLKLRF